MDLPETRASNQLGHLKQNQQQLFWQNCTLVSLQPHHAIRRDCLKRICGQILISCPQTQFVFSMTRLFHCCSTNTTTRRKKEKKQKIRIQ